MAQQKNGALTKVRFVKTSKYPERQRHRFKEILAQLLKKPLGHRAQIQCETAEEAKLVQRGFHSAGSARRVKAQYKIKTRRPTDLIVEAWLEA